MENKAVDIFMVQDHPEARLPVYETSGAAGADLRAVFDDGEGITLEPGDRCIVSTGLRMQIPEGYEVQIRARSGLAAKKGVTVLNGVGTIDSDFRGVVGVILCNLSREAFSIRTGDKIAQMVVAPVEKGQFSFVDHLTATVRDRGGFGSTG